MAFFIGILEQTPEPALSGLRCTSARPPATSPAMRNRILAALVAATAFLAAPAASQAYVHQANAEQACASTTVDSANATFGLYGGYVTAWAAYGSSYPGLTAPNRVSDVRILVSIGWYGNPGTMALNERCDVRSTNGADTGIYVYSFTQSAPY